LDATGLLLGLAACHDLHPTVCQGVLGTRGPFLTTPPARTRPRPRRDDAVARGSRDPTHASISPTAGPRGSSSARAGRRAHRGSPAPRPPPSVRRTPPAAPSGRRAGAAARAAGTG